MIPVYRASRKDIGPVGKILIGIGGICRKRLCQGKTLWRIRRSTKGSAGEGVMEGEMKEKRIIL
jgi:hypothetical protein